MVLPREVWRATELVRFTRHLAFSPDGGALASSAYDGVVQLWDTVTGKEVRRIQHVPEGKFGHPSAALAFSPDGQMLAVATAPGEKLRPG